MLKKLNYEKVYFYTIALFVFTMPISRAAVSFFSIILPLIWIVEGDFKKKFEIIKNTPTLKIFLLFISFLILSLLWTENYSDAKRPIRLLGYFMTMYVVATSFKPIYTRKIISFFLAGMFISEVLTYGIYFNLWKINDASPAHPSPFMFHIDYSIFLAFTSVLLLYRLFSPSYNFKEKIIYTFFFLTVTGNLFITNGRTGQVAFIAGLIVMMILYFRFSIKAFILSFVTLSIIFVTAYNTSSIFKNRVHSALLDIQQMQQKNFNTSWGIRVAFYVTTLNILKEHPLVGVGVGDFMQATKNELTKNKYASLNLSNSTKHFMSGMHPHSQYLLILLQVGTIGLSLFVAYLFYFTQLSIKSREIKETSLLFITVFIVGFIPEPLLVKQFTLVLFSLFSGIFIANSIQQQNYRQQGTVI